MLLLQYAISSARIERKMQRSVCYVHTLPRNQKEFWLWLYAAAQNRWYR